MQNRFLHQISRLLPDGKSLNETIATALDISYDAAHRRTSGKSKLSLEEGLRLAAHFNCSLDALQENTSKNIVAVQKTQQIETAQDLEGYFKSSAVSVRALSVMDEVQLYYSAKDIPLFYTLSGDLLSRFKMYVWLRLLSSSKESVPFLSYKIPLSTLEAAKELGKLYAHIPKTEIWDTTTFNSTLKQIHFYYQAGLLDARTAQELCNLLSKLLVKIKSRVIENNSGYELYHNELLLMNNTVFIDTPHQKAFYIPFTFLSYFLATDVVTCEQAHTYIKKQLGHSKLLNTSGEMARQIFFNKLDAKIEALSLLIAASDTLDFD